MFMHFIQQLALSFSIVIVILIMYENFQYHYVRTCADVPKDKTNFTLSIYLKSEIRHSRIESAQGN